MGFLGTIQQALANAAPWFMRNPNLGRFLESVSLTLDTAAQTLKQGLQLSQPLLCDASALPVLSRDRGIRLYSSESEVSQRHRLSIWRQLRRQFGTHAGELRNIQPFFLSHPAMPRMRIVHQSGDGDSATWHTLEPDGTYSWTRTEPSNWDWDGQPEKWSRFWLIIYTDQILPPAVESPSEWDDADGDTWGGGQVWDGLLTSSEISDLVAGVIEAKSAHSIFAGLILATDPASFDPAASPIFNGDGWSTLPAGNWNYVIDNLFGYPTRLPGASFVYDRGPW